MKFHMVNVKVYLSLFRAYDDPMILPITTSSIKNKILIKVEVLGLSPEIILILHHSNILLEKVAGSQFLIYL